MCTYVTHNVVVSGSAKGPTGWFPASRATVYFDHPFHAPFEHSLNIDIADAMDPTKRVAVELSPASARALASAILAVVDGVALAWPPALDNADEPEGTKSLPH